LFSTGSLARLLSFVPSIALGQAAGDTTRTDSTTRRLGTVTVSASRSAGTVSGTSTVVVRPTELRTPPAPVLHQALRELPFVLVRQNSRGEMELSVRGSDSRQAAVLIDGVPVTIGWDHRADPSIIPITGADRIVVVRGLSTLLNGPNTSGGSIEVTHDPLLLGNSLQGGFGVDETSAITGSLGGGWRLLDMGGGLLSLRAGVAHRQRDGLVLPDGAPDPTSVDGLRTNTDLKETDGFVALRWTNGIGRSIGFTISALDAEKGVPPEEHLSAPRLWRYPYHRRTLAAFSANTGMFSTPLGHGSLEIGAGYNGGQLKIESYDSRDYTTVNGTELGDERTTMARALLTHSLGSATLRTGITVADVRYEEPLPPDAPANYRQQLQSTGAEVDYPLGSRTTVAGGFVFDRSQTPETGGRTPGQEAFDNTGWRAGITHDLGDTWRVHASANERSRFPALRELYSGSLNRFTPNPDLKPETLHGLEAGLTMARDLSTVSRATVALTAFRHRLEDAVVRITLSNPTRFMRVNRDRIESKGIEVMAGLVVGQDRERTVTLNGDATFLDISIFDETAGDAQRHAENNPETRARLELGVPLPWQIRGFATARHTGVQYCLNGETGNEMRLAAKTTADLAVQRTFATRTSGPFRWMRAILGMDNVTDAAVYDQCGLPQPGRTLRLMMTIG
jgi:iron complex outermembrane receptor protein